MRAQPPGGAGPAGRSSVSAGGCHLPSGHASLPRVRQRSRRATGTLRPLQPLPQLLPASGWEGALGSPKIWAGRSRQLPGFGPLSLSFHPTPWGSSSPTQDVSLVGQPGCPTRGSPAPRDPSLLPRGGIWGAGCSHGARHVPAESPGALCSREQSPSPTRRLLLGFNTSLRPLQVSGKTIIIEKKKVFSVRDDREGLPTLDVSSSPSCSAARSQQQLGDEQGEARSRSRLLQGCSLPWHRALRKSRGAAERVGCWFFCFFGRGSLRKGGCQWNRGDRIRSPAQ